MMKTPDGKFMGSVKIGSKGQIIIPKEVRDMFNIETRRNANTSSRY